MSVNIKVAQTTVTASTTVGGTQDITISGFGTPKAALFIMTVALTDNTVAVQASFNIGATDGTRSWCLSTTSRNASASTSNRARGMTTRCIAAHSITGVSSKEASFTSWITDGVRITWNTNTINTGYLLTVVLFGGSDLTARADTISLGTSTSAQTYSSLSAEPDLVIGACQGGTNNSTMRNLHDITFGLCHNDKAGTITQRCIAQAEVNGGTDGVPISWMDDDKFLMQIDTAVPGTPVYNVALSSFTSTGFDFTCNNSASSDDIGILALSLNGGKCSVGTYSPVTSATTDTISAAFTPTFCLLGLCGNTAVDTQEEDGDAGVFAISAIDAAAQSCLTIAIEDLSGTTDTQSLVDNQAIKLPAHDGASNLYDATLTSLNSSGVNLSYSTASATTRKWIYMLISDESAAAAAGFFFRSNNTMRAMLRR